MRRERERRQIGLDAISESTKISTSLLEGLERDDISRWPPGIFRRSFVRSYAEAVGLDPDSVVREFAAYFEDGGTEVHGRRQSRLADSHAAPLRLTLDEESTWFGWTRLLSHVRRCWWAVALDIAVVLAGSALTSLVLGGFWTALGVVAVGYHIVGTLLTGASPGLALFEARSAEQRQANLRLLVRNEPSPRSERQPFEEAMPSDEEHVEPPRLAAG